LHAIGLDNGNRIWKSQSMASIYAKPVVHDGFIIIGAWDGTLYILGKDTGNIAGKYMTGSEITAPVSVSDKTIFVGTRDGKIYSIQMF